MGIEEWEWKQNDGKKKNGNERRMENGIRIGMGMEEE